MKSLFTLCAFGVMIKYMESLLYDNDIAITHVCTCNMHIRVHMNIRLPYCLLNI